MFIFFGEGGNRGVTECHVDKYGITRQATDGNVTGRRKDAICMPGNFTHTRNM